MTIRKKNKETGEEELTKVNVWQVLLSTQGFRLVLIILVVSMHPVGRQLLGTFGFEFPDQRKLSVAAEEAKSSKAEITAISESVKEIKSDIASLKANNAIINQKVDTLDQTFRGFQIDFNKWKPKETKP